MKISLKISLLCLCLISKFLHAQPFADQVKFVHISTKDGLSQSSIFAIAQDHLDLMWVGTRDGLNKYDAHRFVTYRNVLSDSTSLSDNYVTAVYEDSDNRLWIGTGQGINLYDRKSDRFLRVPLVGRGSPEPFIYAIDQDRNGNVWFCSSAGLFLLKSNPENQLQCFLVFNGRNIAGHTFPPGSGNVQQVYQDSRGRHWLSTTNGVYVFEGLSRQSTPQLIYDIQQRRGALNSADVRFVYEMKPGIFWMGTKEGGINVYEEEKDTFRYITNDGSAGNRQASLSSNDVRSLVRDRQGGYWIGTINGLNYYDEKLGFISFLKDQYDTYSLADNSIRPIFQDRRGSIWVGTYYGGISIFDRDLAKFRHYGKNGQDDHLSYSVVSGIVQDRQGGFWIGYEGGGLDYMTTNRRVKRHYKHKREDPRSLTNNHVKHIYLDSEDNLWVGTYTGGLNLFKKDGQGFVHYKHDPDDISSLSNNNVYSITEDKVGNLWIGTYGGGLNVKKAGTEGYFESYRSTNKEQYRLGSDLIRIVYLDSRENLWVGTEDGLHVKWAGADRFDVFHPQADNSHSISGNVILSVYEDEKGRLWIGTSMDGLNEFRYATKDFRRIGTENGLPGNNVVGIAEEDGILWLSTNKGICAFDPSTDEIVSYNLKDGLYGNEFSVGAVCHSREGELLLGGTHGITAFYPSKISRSRFRPKMIFSEVRVHNKVLLPESNQLSNQHISMAKELRLSHRDNNVSIDFATLNYITPEKNKYAYRLEGLEEDWNYVNFPTATYTNLHPGTYILEVKGTTNDGVWSDEVGKLRLVVLPPWWATWWAYTTYIVTFLVVLLMVWRFFNARRELKYQLRLKQLEAVNEKKMADIKANFYTHISHELRTPLTLILGPVHQMLSEMAENDPRRSTLQVVRQNTQRLLRLVNELLDSRKNELNLVRLNVSEYPLLDLVQEVLASFQEEIRAKNVVVEWKYKEPLPVIWFDYMQMEKVFFNLLGNALRFVPQGGRVWIHVSTTTEISGKGIVRLEIGDDGPGITEEDLPFIFELFYQSKSPLAAKNRYGSGLGLALTRDIIRLHGGKINASSQHEKLSTDSFTVFTLEMHVGNAHFDTDKVDFVDTIKEEANTVLPEKAPMDFLTDGILNDGSNVEKETDSALVLVVDDNDDILQFLQQELVKEYTVVTAHDGEQAWDIVRKRLPDVVISDVMMPNMDGVCLTTLIKSNEMTAHIPVILLTALSSEEDMLVGMGAGSDDYLTKPVHMDLLMIKIQNILYTKKSVRRWFIRKYMLATEDKRSEKPNEEQLFLNRIVNVIESRLSSEDLNVMQLSSELGMSRPVLYKKIKQLTGMSIIELINMLRLRRATELFDRESLGISDIAYQVGYSDPKWFSKTFKSYYGITPKRFAEMAPAEKARIIDEHNLFHIFQTRN
ncbi:response regulator [Sphingobacterium phlebotomi]|uniref:histidine kinase n=1 Tax=Sphingobacterium phlebotomi TaxID=2605433 RepID=A0A5D4H9W4_9SPHI|nr:two-component regulator propeller domain-containing protein [Sphingobacterium phlebotomi]TYR37092.1 response regulator [Sphingobacterium phlebotomi]